MKVHLLLIYLFASFFLRASFPPDAIVISGQPGPMFNKKHFLENGLDRSLKLRNAFQKVESTEKVVWVIYDSGNSKRGAYPDSILQNYIALAKIDNIETLVVRNNKDLLKTINSRTDSTDNEDKFSKLFYYGHATLGNLEIGFVNGYFWNKLFSTKLNVNKLKSAAFTDSAMVNVVGGCRTALPPNYFRKKSVAEQFQRLTCGKIFASDVRVYYPGGPVSDKTLVRKNNGNIIEFQGNKE
jgi:hypothetical protein